MINFVVLLSVLLLFMEYDVVLRIGRVLHRDRPIAYSEHILTLALGRIFSLIRSYRGFTMDFEDRLGPEGWPERFILVANHQSIADIPVVAYLLLRHGKRVRFVAKKELGAGVPLVSQVLRMQGHGLVSRRTNPSESLRSLDRFARKCRETGACPVIFPEGTRSKDGSLGHFHAGGLKRILGAEALPLVVVALEGGCRIRGPREVLSSLKGASYQVRVLGVLPPPQGRQALIATAERSRAMIAEALAEWRGRAHSA